MQILCVSDSHGDLGALVDLLERMTGHFDLLLHLGDGAREMAELSLIYPTLEYAAVQGNCDRSGEFPPSHILIYHGVKLMMTHGHLYGVKGSLEPLRAAAREEGVSLALFGHTHSPYAREEEGLLLFNPGSISSRQGGGTYGLLTLERGRVVRWGHFSLEGTPLL